jgi:hypothetical protein
MRILQFGGLGSLSWGRVRNAVGSSLAVFVFLLSSAPMSNASLVVDLRIEVTSSKGRQGSWSVKCYPARGSHPNVNSSCAFLKIKSNRGMLAGVVSDNCLEVYGGAANARVRGVLYGKRIDLDFDRSNSCNIQKWDQIVTLLRFR